MLLPLSNPLAPLLQGMVVFQAAQAALVVMAETVQAVDMCLHFMVVNREVAQVAEILEARAEARAVVLVMALAEDREVALAAVLVMAKFLLEAVADPAEMVVILAAAAEAVDLFLLLQSLLLVANENHASRKRTPSSSLLGRRHCNFHSGAGTLATRSRRLQAGLLRPLLGFSHVKI